MKTLRQSLGYLIAGILLYFLIKPFLQTHTQLKDASFQIHYGWLVCSFVAILFYWSAYLYPFATLLSGITEKQVSFRTAFTLFHLANITRYLPGRIWGVVRLLSLSNQFGVSKTAVGSSLTLHVGVETALGGLIAMSLLFSKQTQATAQTVLENVSGHTLLFTLVGLGCIAGVLFFIPTVSTHARQFLKTLRSTGTPLFQKSFRHQWLNIFATHLLLWCCQGFAFFLFLRSLASVAWTDAGILTTCYAFAWIAGFLSFLTPGGLGVREGLLSLLLSSYMPISQATLVALLCRVWILSAELVLAGAAFYLRKKSNFEHECD
ncbi:MAG: lysylphosphatidylglycerol synthase domain-containing protein [Candidatus Poribacteria bacterium]|nr:lysylphosphatidylglycerol synthase domain-containing protein [Candidatus Poribacteria bacterium]